MSKNPAWLGEVPLQQFFAATQAMGGEARAVGGAVRDFLMGRGAGDVDLASTLLPEQTMELAATNGWKAIPTGIAHGTVTVVLPGRVIEVTTLRRDVETDGRHAKVAYTDKFEEDAARRDFTFNALYMDAHGEVFDFFGGRKDLETRSVRFIGDAGTRIDEDGLRILRYFRFLATHGSAVDAEALRAIKEKRGMIANLSGERIATEMSKLFHARDPLHAIEQMQDCELAPLLTDTQWNAPMLQKLLQQEAQQKSPALGWVRLLSLIKPGAREEAARFIAERWKLSRAERTHLTQLAEPMQHVSPAMVKEQLRAMARLMVEGKLLLAAVDGAVGAELPELLKLARTWQIPAFPVTASDLLTQGFKEGFALGETLRALEHKWVESDYMLSKDALLQTIA